MRALLVALSLAGAADTASFLVSRRRSLLANPGRGAGSLVGLALWAGLCASAAVERRTGRRTLAIASAVSVANGALLAVHLLRRIRSPRVFLGAGLAAAGLGAAAAGAARTRPA